MTLFMPLRMSHKMPTPMVVSTAMLRKYLGISGVYGVKDTYHTHGLVSPVSCRLIPTSSDTRMLRKCTVMPPMICLLTSKDLQSQS